MTRRSLLTLLSSVLAPRIAMPPLDTQAASTGVRVGGHQSHAVPTTPSAQVFKPVLCSECHGIGVNTYTTTHSNSVSDVTFASATSANLGGVSPSIVQGTPPTADSCTVYCHGASLTAAQRGSVATWSWNTTTNATCGSCHGAAPNDAVHTTVSKTAPATACNACHATVVNTSGGFTFGRQYANGQRWTQALPGFAHVFPIVDSSSLRIEIPKSKGVCLCSALAVWIAASSTCVVYIITGEQIELLLYEFRSSCCR